MTSVHDMPARITLSEPIPRPTARQMVNAVVLDCAERHCVDIASIMDTSQRTRRISRARWDAWHTIRADTKWSLPRIASFWKTDHTTVLYGIKRFEAEQHMKGES